MHTAGSDIALGQKILSNLFGIRKNEFVLNHFDHFNNVKNTVETKIYTKLSDYGYGNERKID